MFTPSRERGVQTMHSAIQCLSFILILMFRIMTLTLTLVFYCTSLYCISMLINSINEACLHVPAMNPKCAFPSPTATLPPLSLSTPSRFTTSSFLHHFLSFFITFSYLCSAILHSVYGLYHSLPQGILQPNDAF